MTDNSYLKYYWLESTFFPEIRKYYLNKKHLTPLHFFAIVSWKSNRPKTIIKKYLLLNNSALNVVVKHLTNNVDKAKSNEEKLNILLEVKGIGLAMASAILTVLYPNDFTIYDYRVWGQVKKASEPREINSVARYFDFVKRIKGLEVNLSLRDTDRNVWGRSWYEDMQKFLKK